MRILFILFFLIVGFQFNSIAQNSKKPEIEFGIFIEDIYKIDYQNSSYDAVFWIWINSDSSFYDLAESIDIIKSSETKFNMENRSILKNGKFHTEAKVYARILNQFDVKNFPFDIQDISFNVELIKFKSVNGFDGVLF